MAAGGHFEKKCLSNFKTIWSKTISNTYKMTNFCLGNPFLYLFLLYNDSNCLKSKMAATAILEIAVSVSWKPFGVKPCKIHMKWLILRCGIHFCTYFYSTMTLSTLDPRWRPAAILKCLRRQYLWINIWSKNMCNTYEMTNFFSRFG